ncbi:MAG: methyltransferase domain-containing protein [Acidimicrobiia bacterium]|nr:methyltransferase domain-containing protein [Acidimicrobiia bacterium]
MARTYHWIAPVHDILARIVEGKARRTAVGMSGLSNGESVLEVAVGTGLNIPLVAQLNPKGRYIGVDITPRMLRRARRRLARTGADPNRYTLGPGDAYNLPFEEAIFDVLINSYMFDMLPQKDFAVVLREFRRVLRPGGRLIMINMTPGPRLYHQIWEQIYRLHPPLLGGCRGIRLGQAARDSGLQLLREAFVSQWTFPSEVLLCRKPGSDTSVPHALRD